MQRPHCADAKVGDAKQTSAVSAASVTNVRLSGILRQRLPLPEAVNAASWQTLPRSDSICSAAEISVTELRGLHRRAHARCGLCGAA
jgi:hypothetical protein